MHKISWDYRKTKLYEHGIDRCVLFPMDINGNYLNGVAWNGVLSITESPKGSESRFSYMDNEKYSNIQTIEEYSASLEAYGCPKEFYPCVGITELVSGLVIQQQERTNFGLSYRTFYGNESYKLHLVYGLSSSHSERQHLSISMSGEPIIQKWTFDSVPIQLLNFDPISSIEIDSERVKKSILDDIEILIYGTNSPTIVEPRLPSPIEILKLTVPIFTVGITNLGYSRIGS